MKNIGYNFDGRLSLNFGKGVRAQPLPSVPKGKSIDYYHMTERRLGYVSDFYASALELDGSASHSHSSSTSSWDFNYSIKELFNGLTVNMSFVNCLEDDEEEGILQLEDDP